MIREPGSEGKVYHGPSIIGQNSVRLITKSARQENVTKEPGSEGKVYYGPSVSE